MLKDEELRIYSIGEECAGDANRDLIFLPKELPATTAKSPTPAPIPSHVLSVGTPATAAYSILLSSLRLLSPYCGVALLTVGQKIEGYRCGEVFRAGPGVGRLVLTRNCRLAAVDDHSKRDLSDGLQLAVPAP